MRLHGILMLVTATLIYLVPALILLGWIISEFRTLHARLSGIGDPLQLAADRDQTLLRIEEVLDNGQAEGLNLRQDGMFDARSMEGRKLNVALEAEHETLDCLQDRLARVTVLRIQRGTMRLAAVIWIAAFLFLGRRSPQEEIMLLSAMASLVAIVVAGPIYLVRKATFTSS